MKCSTSSIRARHTRRFFPVCATYQRQPPQGRAIDAATADFNSNGRVDAADLVVWRKNKGTNSERDPGDADRDGVVDDFGGSLMEGFVWRAGCQGLD
jgi:hypothetical protein